MVKSVSKHLNTQMHDILQYVQIGDYAVLHILDQKRGAAAAYSVVDAVLESLDEKSLTRLVEC